MKIHAIKQSVLLGTLAIILSMSFMACKKKDDPAVADAGGGVASKRNVITLQGAAR